MVKFYSKIIQGTRYYRGKVLKCQNNIGKRGGKYFLFYADNTTIFRIKGSFHTTHRLREQDSEFKLTLMFHYI